MSNVIRNTTLEPETIANVYEKKEETNGLSKQCRDDE